MTGEPRLNLRFRGPTEKANSLSLSFLLQRGEVAGLIGVRHEQPEIQLTVTEGQFISDGRERVIIALPPTGRLTPLRRQIGRSGPSSWLTATAVSIPRLRDRPWEEAAARETTTARRRQGGVFELNPDPFPLEQPHPGAMSDARHEWGVSPPWRPQARLAPKPPLEWQPLPLAILIRAHAGYALQHENNTALRGLDKTVKLNFIFNF